MKQLFLLGLMVLGLSNCGQKSDNPTPDPLLGHWEADGLRLDWTTPDGQIKRTDSVPGLSTLDVTPTTMITSFRGPGGVWNTTYSYTRRGEVITMTRPVTGAQFNVYARSLTPTSFTYVSLEPALSPGEGPILSTMLFHR